MDWDLAIKRNSEALKGIVEALFAMLGLVGEATVSRIPQPLHRAVLRVLRPAESAVRRLIIIAARGLVVKLPAAPSRPMPAGPIGKGVDSRSLLPALRSAQKLRRTPQKRQAAYPAHPYLRRDLWGNDPTVAVPVGNAPSLAIADPPSAARWPRQCRTPQPEAPGPQAGAR